jgi:hypothetical protein
MADGVLLIPENTSTARSAIADNYSGQTRWSGGIDAYLPSPQCSKDEGSDVIERSGAQSTTTPDPKTTPQPPPLIRLKNAAPIIPRDIQILQHWEGVVREVGSGEFTADLTSLIKIDPLEVTGEFSFDEVSDADRPLVEPGAVFYWAIGYDKSPAGQITRVSEIRFRRSPEWNARKLEAVRSEAEQWFRSISQDESEPATK